MNKSISGATNVKGAFTLQKIGFLILKSQFTLYGIAIFIPVLVAFGEMEVMRNK